MASSRISLTSKPPSSTIKTSSEPSEVTSSDFEDIFETSTSASAFSTSAARRPVVTSSSRPTIRSTSISSISSTSKFSSTSISSVIQTSIPTSVAPPNLFPVSSSEVSRPTSVAATSHNQNVFTPVMIAIIAASSFALVLFVVGLIFLVRYRRRRNRLSRTKEGGSRDLDSEEKYGDRSHYARYADSQHKDPLMDQGMAPLLNVPSIGQHSRSTSFSSSLESHLYHEGPTSPFLNENERQAESTTAMNPDRTPYTFAEVGDTALDSVVLLPAVPPPIPQSRATAAASKLSPLYIPESYKTVPPSRRRSKGKNWNRASTTVNATASPADTDCDSDDSASLYSQASASTYRTFTAPTRQLTNPPFNYPSITLPSIPQSPYQTVSTVAASSSSSSKLERPSGIGIGGSAANLAYVPSPVESLGAREEEGNAGLGKEETILVATLLQSRLSRVPKQGLAPTRSDSVVSHIERAGSIKPVLPSTETAGRASRYGPRSRARRTQDAQAVRTQILPESELRSGGSEYQQTS